MRNSRRVTNDSESDPTDRHTTMTMAADDDDGKKYLNEPKP